MRRCSRCWPAARRVTQPESTSHDAGKADTGESAHFRALERLYLSAPINQFFPSRLIIDEAGHSRIEFSLDNSEEHTYELKSQMRTSYTDSRLKKKNMLKKNKTK